MSYTISYVQNEGIVLITNTGEMTYKDFVKQTQEALEVGRVNNCKLFLTDCTSMISRFQTVEIFNTQAVYEKIAAPRTNRLALVTSTDKEAKADINFYETVCVNRGWPVRVFTDKDSAMKWLRE